MDPQSWLWRKKSLEKSLGVTESSGSSHSGRFCDDQACSNNHSQSPEITSRAAPYQEEHNNSVTTLTEKLSAAFLTISAKEDLVKQHAKVAEEAVSGWEKAESEALALHQQLEAAAQKNTALEDRVGHLDGALKECLRQLRQAREDQGHKVHEAVSRKKHKWKLTKSQLQTQLVELQSQVQASKSKQEMMTIERDMNANAAEIASKQHLESIKKVTKLESEIHRLKNVARKAAVLNDHRSATASSVCVESFTDSQSESGLETNELDSWASALIGERDQFKNDKAIEGNLLVPSVEINLMDDFLEMERLAALPEMENGCCRPHEWETPPLKAEFEAMTIRIAEMEEKLEKMGTEKVELELALSEFHDQLKASGDQLVQAKGKLEEIQTCLSMANEMRIAAGMELEIANAKKESAELQLLVVEGEIKTLLSKIGCLEEEVRKEKALSEEAMTKCLKLEDESLRMKHEVDIRNAAILNEDLKLKKEEEEEEEEEEELSVAAATKFAECQKTISSLGRQLKSLAEIHRDNGRLPNSH